MEETDHDKAIGYYRDGKYDLFLPLAEKIYKENDVSEFLCQALSNVYFVNKEYEKALNVNTACIACFQDKSNLDNRLKILEKLGSSYDDERGTTLIRLFTMTSENSYIQSYISLKIVSPPSFLTIYELVRKIKPLFFTNIIYMLFTIQPYGFLLYGKKLLAKALDVEKEESVESVEAVDNRVIEQSKKSTDADEKYVCILYLILPQLFYTPEEIEKDYRRIMTNLEKIQTVSADISKHFILSNFTYYYTYFGYNIRSIHQLFSSFLRKNYTPISSLQTPIKTAPDKRDRIRIGFFSNLIFKNHSVCRDRLGIIKHLCNDPIFDVFLIRYKQIEKDVLHKNIMKDTSFTEVLLESGESTDKDEQTVLGLSLDILVYPEIGMDMNVYLMAHKRIAPIQINTWGHSETSGINTIDYYISSEYFEGENAQEYYSEKLIQMKSLSTYYYNLNILFNEFTVPIDSLKTQYQLFPSFQLYGIFQSTFKYHPTLMAMIRGILEKNQRAFFILLIAQECWKEFMDYAEKMIGQNVHRIKMIDKMGTIPYCNLLRCMDIMIDSYPFGGCNTSLDSFHFNKIVLTLPSEKLNGRFTLGFYKKMKIMEPVCHSVDELVDKAVYYAKNTEVRKTVEDMINDRKHLLFKEQESLLEWNNQMRALVNVEPRKARTRTFVLQNKLETYPENVREILREEHVVSLPLKMQLNDTVVWLPLDFSLTQLLEWIEVLNMKNNEPGCTEIAVSKETVVLYSVHMVLARYKEDISFLKNYHFSAITVYNKGPSINIDNVKNVNSLPNIGKCDHTYLTYIINNYERLDEITLFLPACFYGNLHKKELVHRLLQKVWMTGKTCFVGKNVPDVSNLHSFQIDSWESTLPENKGGVPVKCDPSPIRPYGKWLEKVFNVKDTVKLNQTFVTYFGIFAVRKEDIRRRPVSFYKKLLSFVKTPNPEAGHYIERSWGLIFKSNESECIFF